VDTVLQSFNAHKDATYALQLDFAIDVIKAIMELVHVIKKIYYLQSFLSILLFLL
jgi:hypothetical protein